MVPSTHSAGQVAEVVTITAAGSEATVDRRTLADAAALIGPGGASAVCVTPGGSGRVVAAPTDVLLVSAEALRDVRAELLDDIAGAGRLADPYTAMLDLQWRLTILGHRVVAVDGPVSKRPEGRVGDRRRRVAGALDVLHTHLGDRLQGPVTAAAQLYVTSRDHVRSGTDATALDLQRSPGGDDVGTLSVPASGLVGALALDTSLDDLDALAPIRRQLQSHRRVPDRALAPDLRPVIDLLLGVETAEDRAAFDAILELIGVPALLAEPIHVLVAFDTPGRRRVDRLVKRLGPSAEVRLLRTTPAETTQAGEPAPGDVNDNAAWADVVVLMSATLDDVPAVERSAVPVVADLSHLDVSAWVTAPGQRHRAEALRALMARADLVLAADSTQRDMLLGALAGQGRVNPNVYDADPTLLSLVRVDPTGDSLADYCRYPLRAADSTQPEPQAPQQVGDVDKAMELLRDGGPGLVVKRAAGRVQRLYHDRARRRAR